MFYTRVNPNYKKIFHVFTSMQFFSVWNSNYLHHSDRKGNVFSTFSSRVNGLIVQYGFVVFFQMKFKLNSVKSYLKKHVLVLRLTYSFFWRLMFSRKNVIVFIKKRISRCITKSVNWEMNLWNWRCKQNTRKFIKLFINVFHLIPIHESCFLWSVYYTIIILKK